MGISVAPLSAPIAETAAELRARRQNLRLPDAIVLASARELQAELLSYDRRLTQHADNTTGKG
jgi:predicted nucleic acid-binding protein